MGLQEEIDKMRQEIRSDHYSMSIGEWISLYENNEIDIHPEFQSQGAYSALLQMLMGYLANQKVEKLSISTQIQNTRVIRVWIKSGFNLEFSLNTFHIMPRH